MAEDKNHDVPDSWVQLWKAAKASHVLALFMEPHTRQGGGTLKNFSAPPPVPLRERY